MKRFTSIILVVVMSLCCIFSNASAASLSWISEPFDQEKSISATGNPDYWYIPYGMQGTVIDTGGQTVSNVMASKITSLTPELYLFEYPQEVYSGKSSISDIYGNAVFDKEYVINRFNDNYLIMSKDSKYGLYDIKSKSFVLPVEYAQISYSTGSKETATHLLLKNADGKWQTFDMRTKTVHSLPDYDNIYFASNTYLNVATVDYAKGLIDVHGNVIAQPDANINLTYISDNLMSCYDKTTKTYSYKDFAGNVKYTFSGEKYDISPIGVDANGNVKMFRYVTKEPYSRLGGLMDTNGNILTEEIYYSTYVLDTNTDLIVVSGGPGMKSGILDLSGNVILPQEYNTLEKLGNNRILCHKYDGKSTYHVIDFNGNVVIPQSEYGTIRKLTDSTLACSKDGKMGVVDFNGNVIIPFKYNFLEKFNDFLLKFGDGKKSGLVDMHGNEILPCQYSSITPSGSKAVSAETVMLRDADTQQVRFARIINTDQTEISVKINGVRVVFDQPPILQNDRTLVPLRAIFEALGATVDWNGETNTVTAVKDGITISLTIGSDQLIIGNTVKTLDVPAQVVNDRTLVPARAVSEALNCKVEWNDDTHTVIISQ